ncbi:hypothetical protein [Nocardia suismassiliense]|uniref:hypothetical protein n=1 Tax=Nocardia suismassiliense TaxID=2077092 RepID=UPI000D1EACAE|nr:hypothetical protein [Nocardia suismassiliense]
MSTVAIRTGQCPIPWCVYCEPSNDPDDHPHCHHDLPLEFELSSPPHSITIERSRRVFGDGSYETSIDIVRADRSGFGVTATDVGQLAEVLRLPKLHYGRETTIELSENRGAPLTVFTEDARAFARGREAFTEDGGVNPRSYWIDYWIHIAQPVCGGGHYFKMTPVEARLLGDLLCNLTSERL